MNKQTEQRLIEMMERLFPRQTADIIAKIEASQKEIDALFRGSTTCHTETTSCPGKMDATKTETTPEGTEAAVERQELFKEEI
jgi:hypothetical protein